MQTNSASSEPARTQSTMLSMEPIAGSAATKYCQLLPLESEANVQEFLNAIHKDFVSTVDPLESGLQDRLIQCGLLTNTDHESLKGGHYPTREEKARRLWQILDSIHYEVFNRDILPVLCEMYHYIIPARFWRIVDRTGPGSTGEGVQEGASAPPSARVSSEKCTRCTMRYRIRPFTLADFLFKTGAITRELYRDLTKNVRTSEPDWPTLFNAFTQLSRLAAVRHQQEMTTLLQHHSLKVPDNLVDLMTGGFPCHCSQPRFCRKVDSSTMNNTTKKPGTSPNETTDRVSEPRHFDDVNQEEESELIRMSDGIPVEHLSLHHCEQLPAEHTGESEALDEDSTENSESSFADVLCRAAERARQSMDLQEFLDYASSNITTAEELTQFLKTLRKAAIVGPSERKETVHLLENYRDLECHYRELCQRLETLQQSGAQEEQDPALPPLDNPHPAFFEAFQLCSQMSSLCKNMLIFRRTFILCAWYLNTFLPRLMSQSTREKANTASHVVMVLLKVTRLEAWQCVQQLDELRKQLPVGVVSLGLLEIISSMRTFLEMCEKHSKGEIPKKASA